MKNILKDDLEELKILSYYDIYKNRNYVDIYKMFFASSGLRKIALGRILAEKMCDEKLLIDVNNIDLFLSSLDIDGLWMLASGCSNMIIKELASEKVMAFLDKNMMKKKVKVYKRKR